MTDPAKIQDETLPTVGAGGSKRQPAGIGAYVIMRAAIADNGLKMLESVWVALVQAGHEVTAARDQLDLDDVVLRSADVLLVGTTNRGEGISRLREWEKTRPPREAVVVIGPAGDVDLKLAAFQAGADDYVESSVSGRELVARAEAAVRRVQRQISPPSGHLIRGPFEVLPNELQVIVEGRQVPLTQTEMRLLITLLEASGRPVTRSDLAIQVWGPHESGAVRRVDVGIARLRRKLERDPSHPRFLRTVRGVGYAIQF